MGTLHKFSSGVVIASLSALLLSGTPIAYAVQGTDDNLSYSNALGSSVETPSATELTDTIREKADPYVSVLGDKFVLDDDAASSVLSEEEQTVVDSSIREANAAIKSASTELNVEKKVTSDAITFSQTTGPQIVNTDGDSVDPYYQPGRNGVEYYWWGVKVLLSQRTVQFIGAGISIAGVWIPEPVVSKLAATLGIAVALAPGGVWADYSYPQIAQFAVTRTGIVPLRAGFQ